MSTDAIALPKTEPASRPIVVRLHDWVTTVDHKRLGILYIIYALMFLLIAGIEATVIRVQGKAAGSDPWDAWTLEWATNSQPPAYNFSDVPTVQSRRPLWDLKHPTDPDWNYE
jgi:heme/copper-type cytochrome/quinol oxidase subunit 1